MAKSRKPIQDVVKRTLIPERTNHHVWRRDRKSEENFSRDAGKALPSWHGQTSAHLDRSSCSLVQNPQSCIDNLDSHVALAPGIWRLLNLHLSRKWNNSLALARTDSLALARKGSLALARTDSLALARKDSLALARKGSMALAKSRKWILASASMMIHLYNSSKTYISLSMWINCLFSCSINSAQQTSMFINYHFYYKTSWIVASYFLWNSGLIKY